MFDVVVGGGEYGVLFGGWWLYVEVEEVEGGGVEDC